MKITERNLQEIGSSLLVSLPKEWTRLLNLKKGDSIKMRVSEEGSLIISPEFAKKQEKKETEFEYTKNFFRDFVRSYFAGNEKITIRIKPGMPNADLDYIHDSLKKLMNVQIIEESSLKIVIKCFRIEELSIEECLRRMYFISLDILDEVISNNNKSKIRELESSLTKFYFMLVMQIRRFLEEGKFIEQNQISLVRAMDCRMVGEKIERIADILRSLYNLNDKDLELIIILRSLYEKSFNCFISNIYGKSKEIFNGNEEKKFERIENNAKKTKNFQRYLQIISLKKILSYTKEIGFLTR